MGSDTEQESRKRDSGLPEVEFKRDLESTNEKLPYPKSVFFIVVNEFCERFSYYGMKAVLVLYLVNVLQYSEDVSTVIYHVFSFLCYFTPLLGAMLADSFLGKFKTIFYLSVVYASGNVLLSLAATPSLYLPPIPFSMLGLGLIALGTGGIKPCVAAFGGDQFVLPQQTVQLASFFSFFYMSINAGSLISTAITPIIRSDVQCFGQDQCYSLAFAIPAALMIVALLVFLAGKPLYREVKPSGNVVVKLVKCVAHAISRKRNTSQSRTHWLDHADDDYDIRFIEDVKIVLRILYLYLPIPVFWALFDQQGSRWTLQATRMDGVVGSYTIKPDQVQVINPALILIFIPLFDNAIYPLLGKCRLIKKPLQRLIVGGILAGIAFIISGVLELELEKTYPNKLTTTQANLNFVNTLPCDITVNFNGNDEEIAQNMARIFEAVEAKTYKLTIKAPKCTGTEFQQGEFEITPKKQQYEIDETPEVKTGGGFTYLITFDIANKIQLAYSQRSDDREKPKEGTPKVRFILAGEFFEKLSPKKTYISLFNDDGRDDYDYVFDVIDTNRTSGSGNIGHTTDTQEVEPLPYEATLVFGGSESSGDTIRVPLKSFETQLGASYVVTISKNGTYTADFKLEEEVKKPENYNLQLITITKESSIHMAWLLPQYIVLTAAEIMFSITGLEFSYSQAPVSMKSVIQAAWLLTVAFGNLIVVIIALIPLFDEQSKEFFLFAGLMFVDMMWFAYMAWRYVPAKLEDPSKKKENE